MKQGELLHQISFKAKGELARLRRLLTWYTYNEKEIEMMAEAVKKLKETKGEPEENLYV